MYEASLIMKGVMIIKIAYSYGKQERTLNIGLEKEVGAF